MYCEQLLAGDFSEYHQNRNGWLIWCQANKNMILREFIGRVLVNESTQDFFGDWCNYKGYSDVGYFLGCEFVKSLTKKYTIIEIANLDVKTVYGELMNFAA